MKKTILLLGVFFFITTSYVCSSCCLCATDDIIDRDHTAENSLDWAGTYIGILPSASGEVIRTELQLEDDNSYVYKTTYLGKEKGKTFTEKGTAQWFAGTIIKLDTNKTETYFLVGENFVELRDIHNNKIKSETNRNYRLEKKIEKKQ